MSLSIQPPEVKQGRSKKEAKSKPSSKLGLGLAMILLGLILISGKSKVAQLKVKSFENEPVELTGLSENEVDEGKIAKRIIIPEVSIDLEVKKSKLINGYWEVFDDSAGWGEGSGIPGEKGNQVIFAHARKGLFLPLRFIKVGDKIYLLTDSKWFMYEVKEIKEVYPNQVEVIAPTEDETLTLYTCSGFADTKRLIVIAKPS